MASARFGKFKPDIGGVRQILKSGPVEAELLGKATSIASACTASCYGDRGHEEHIESDEVPFHGWTSKGGYTAFGHVSTVNLEGLLYEKNTKVMESYNH